MENVFRSQWGFECIAAGQDLGSKGAAVLFKNNFEYKVHSVVKDDEGRYILIDIEMLNKSLTIASIYIYMHQTVEITLNLFGESYKRSCVNNESVVIGGDWNVALNPKIDSKHLTNIYCARSQKQIVDFMYTWG